jgi:formylglycine-generating enzyme required for sulfatase activity
MLRALLGILAILLLAAGRLAAEPARASPAEEACDGVLVQGAAGDSACIKPGSGQSFKDCAGCPEMVVAPAGSFTMGAQEDEDWRYNVELPPDPLRYPWPEGVWVIDDTVKPQHEVHIARPFAVGRFAVTFAEWDACVADGGCGGYKPSDEGWGRGSMPVINVNWDDAKAYVAWLSKKTGKEYRLLSEAEREYVTRAGTTTPFWWGEAIATDQANFDGTYTYKGGTKGTFRRKTVPVQSFAPNPWGLYQVHGNVFEWVEDCSNPDYKGAPGDGTAWLDGHCPSRMLRGGAWDSYASSMRAAYRNWAQRETRSYAQFGFRCARVLK